VAIVQAGRNGPTVRLNSVLGLGQAAARGFWHGEAAAARQMGTNRKKEKKKQRIERKSSCGLHMMQGGGAMTREDEALRGAD